MFKLARNFNRFLDGGIRGCFRNICALCDARRNHCACVYGATLTLQAEPNLPAITAFAGELNQIWSNLVDNALDAVGENGRVELIAAREVQSVSVRVIDNGAGIPENIVSRIFDPFFTTKPVGKGTGLGLDIVRRLVQRNSGYIEVKSQPGRTEFQVCFPIAETQNAGTPR